MKVKRVFIKKYIKNYQELFRESATWGFGYKLSDSRGIYKRELLYYGLKKFENGVEIPLYLICLEALLTNGSFSLPRNPNFNKFVRSIQHYIKHLENLGIVETTWVNTISPLHLWIKQTTEELASGFKEIGSRIDELENKLGVDLTYFKKYENIDYSEIKSGKQLVSDEEIDILEKIFNSVIVPRWKYVRGFEKSLYSFCQQILEGWKENERIEQFVKERNINVPLRFRARIKAPKELLEDSTLTCDQVSVSLIEPLSINEIKNRLDYSLNCIRGIIHILDSYGFLEKIGNRYVLKSIHPFEIAISKLSKRMDKYRKYVKAIQLVAENTPRYKISEILDIPYNTVVTWEKGRKPNPISYSTAELLYKRGIISQDELDIFKAKNLIRLKKF